MISVVQMNGSTAEGFRTKVGVTPALTHPFQHFSLKDYI